LLPSFNWICVLMIVPAWLSNAVKPPAASIVTRSSNGVSGESARRRTASRSPGRRKASRSPARARSRSRPKTKLKVPDVFEGPWQVSHFLGFLFLAISLPPVAIVVGTATLWYFIDPITGRVCGLFSKLLSKIGSKMTRNEVDGFMFPVLLLQGVFIPALFFWAYTDHMANNKELNLWYAFGYQLLRIGPYFTSFAYAYTLCHKEGHNQKIGLWKKPYSYALSHAWNWWIGVFYGVMPSSFAYGHSQNHHTYNNDEDDTVTTWDRPRDSFLNYVRYLPRWCLYHVNISTYIQFSKEGKYDIANKVVGGTLFYASIFGFFFYQSPVFAVAYLGYPLIEACLLLSAINWSWHSFLDPDTTNIYAYSVTIFDGEENTNILNEDYHVVHHQYPGAHWTKHPALFEKHKQDYINNKATCFRQTHAMEIFFFAILKKYDLFADKFVDLSGEMSRDEIEALIKTRLRTCSWGTYENKVK